MENSEINIVIVDDTPINIIMLEKLLQNRNYNVISFPSAEGVVEYLENNFVNLILLDIMMPKIDGFELCRMIKEREAISKIPVIFISAKNEENDKVTGFELGAVDYIEKPFKALELLSRVDTHIQARLAKVKLEKMNVDKDKFLAILSHDLRGPFTSILGNLELLAYEDIKEENSDSIKDLVTDITTSSKNFYKLLEDLLQWGLIQRGKIVAKPELVNIYQIFELEKTLYSHSFKQKEITLEIQCDDSLTMFVDPFMIKEAISNLLSNAIKFTKREGRIILRADDLDSEITISIIDNGVGLEESQIKNLFNLSSSNSTTGTEMEKGTGLGMILVDEFINKNKGKIEVISVVNSGTTFKLVFNK